MEDDIFKSHFRISASVFELLVKEISEYWKSPRLGRSQLSLKKSLLVTIWFLANRNTYREISDRFNISLGGTYTIILKICKILSMLKKKYISWPDINQFEELISQFNILRGSNSFPNVVGCVDGTHIKISEPAQDSISYFNRKSFHSVLLQVVCDSQLKIRDFFFGWPGSCHDAYIWKNSPLGKSLEEKSITIPENAHLLGDSAYPLKEYLLTPYKDNGKLTKQQRNYNYKHSATRTCVEQCIGLLKTKFRVLNYLNLKNTIHAKYIVVACLVLHNFILEKSDITHRDNLIELNYESTYLNDFDYNGRETNENGKLKRDSICALLST